jgi:PleD family two-component response regulator
MTDLLMMETHSMTEAHRIVIVEDDVALAKGLQRLLNADGFEAALAFDGAGLRTLLDNGDIDLVLLDLNLGSEDGMEIARDLGRTRSAGQDDESGGAMPTVFAGWMPVRTIMCPSRSSTRSCAPASAPCCGADSAVATTCRW